MGASRGFTPHIPRPPPSPSTFPAALLAYSLVGGLVMLLGGDSGISHPPHTRTLKIGLSCWPPLFVQWQDHTHHICPPSFSELARVASNTALPRAGAGGLGTVLGASLPSTGALPPN